MRLQDTIKALRSYVAGRTDDDKRELAESALYHLVHQKRVNRKIRKAIKK